MIKYLIASSVTQIMAKKIYFAGSIRGGRDDKDSYYEIIQYLQTYATVLTEHIGDNKLTTVGEIDKSEEHIYNRDVSWIKESDLVIAEVSNPSLGVGYEIAYAESLNRPILCLYKAKENRKLSAMLRGNQNITLKEYKTIGDAKKEIDIFLSLKNKHS